MKLFFLGRMVIKSGFIFLLVFYSLSMNARELIYHLTYEQWSIPRSVNTILTLNSISSVMKSLRLNSDSALTIRYPGGDEGSLWATELRGWLISLGLSSSRINLIPGSSDINQLDLVIYTNIESTTIIN